MPNYWKVKKQEQIYLEIIIERITDIWIMGSAKWIALTSGFLHRNTVEGNKFYIILI